MQRPARVVAVLDGSFVVDVDGAYLTVDAAGVAAEPGDWVLVEGRRATGRADRRGGVPATPGAIG